MSVAPGGNGFIVFGGSALVLTTIVEPIYIII
jgi:hypothetical protein